MIAHGTGTSAINGHPESWLDDIRLDNVRLFVSHDPQAPYENTDTALRLRHARNFAMKDVEIRWEKPQSAKWQTGLAVEEVRGLLLDGVDVAAAPGSGAPVMTLKDVEDVTLRYSRANTLRVAGAHTNKVRLFQTEAKITMDPGVAQGAIVRQ